VIEIKMGDLGKFEGRLGKELRAAQLRAMHKVGKAGVRMLAFASANVKDLGTYQTGWRYQAAFTRLYFRNTAKHAVFVERGRRAGAPMPPLAPIRAWALRHGLPASAAWPIAKKIAKRGIAPRPTLFRPQIQQTITQVWKAAMSASVVEAARRARK
jgi:hypothetical protein